MPSPTARGRAGRGSPASSLRISSERSTGHRDRSASPRRRRLAGPRQAADQDQPHDAGLEVGERPSRAAVGRAPPPSRRPARRGWRSPWPAPEPGRRCGGGPATPARCRPRARAYAARNVPAEVGAAEVVRDPWPGRRRRRARRRDADRRRTRCSRAPGARRRGRRCRRRAGRRDRRPLDRVRSAVSNNGARPSR